MARQAQLDRYLSQQSGLGGAFQRSLAFDLAAQAQRHIEGLDRFETSQRLLDRSMRSYLDAARSVPGTLDLVFRNAATEAFRSWGGAAGQNLVDDVTQRLVTATSVGTKGGDDASVAEMVTKAVLAALAERNERIDWKFVVGMVVTLLIFLHQELGSRATERELTSRIAEVHERLYAHDQLFDLLLTKQVARRTPLRVRPRSGSAELGVLEEGATVVVLERRGKWTRIAAAMHGMDADSAKVVGWILNKYLH